MIAYTGLQAADLGGRRIYGAAQLAVAISLPSDRREMSYDLVIEGMAGADLHPLAPRRLPLEPVDVEAGTVALGALLSDHTPMLIRLRAALCLRDESRAISAAVAFVWCGLDQVSDRGFAGRVPLNAEVALFDGASPGPSGIGFHCDRGGDPVRLAFQRIGIEPGGKPWTFLFRAADILVRVVRPDPGGQTRVTTIAMGDTVSIGDDLPADIILQSDDPEAALTIGHRRIDGAFRRNVSRYISHVTLMELCRGSATSLILHKGPGQTLALDLCRIVRPSTPRLFRLDVGNPRGTMLTLDMGRPISSLRMEGTELLSGRTMELELDLGLTLLAPGHPFAGASLERCQGTAVKLFLPNPNGQRSAWLNRLAVQLDCDGGFDPLRSARGDEFVLPIAAERGSRLADPLQAVGGLGSEEAAGVARHAYEALLHCYDQSSWEHMRWLPGLMRRAASVCRRAGCTHLLLPVLGATPPVDAGESWVPMTSPWDMAPALWTLPGSAYEGEWLVRSPLRTGLNFIRSIDTAVLVRTAIQEGLIDSAFYSYYSNLQEAHRSDDIRLAGFRFDAFFRTLAESDGQASGQCALAPRRHAEALKRLRRSYYRASVGEANIIRLGQATGVSNRCAQAQARLLPWVREVAERGWAGSAVPSGDAGVVDDDPEILRTAPLLLSSLAMAARFSRFEINSP